MRAHTWRTSRTTGSTRRRHSPPRTQHHATASGTASSCSANSPQVVIAQPLAAPGGAGQLDEALRVPLHQGVVLLENQPNLPRLRRRVGHHRPQAFLPHLPLRRVPASSMTTSTPASISAAAISRRRESRSSFMCTRRYPGSTRPRTTLRSGARSPGGTAAAATT